MSMRSTLLASSLAWVCCVTLLSGCSDDEETPGTPPPSELEGDWRFGTISFTNFFGDQGQYIGNAGGVAVAFDFDKSGKFKQQVYINQRDYNCVTQTWTEMEGTATFDGATFTTHPSKGRFKASDNCISANNFDRSMTADERENRNVTYTWKFGKFEGNPDDPKTYLMISQDQGQNWNYFQRP
ncbi:hypothetical protein POL68_40135 [Stigmatella sp. ncwal1]|uniref:Lipocalin-like domain-containing protein n=1 Tax=Stigmatella ashevillensis TaxID=2995309 RepID=A0ABT5DMA9_9BACT|nr:hypothetical protein [Stigmatella ashevillena]MDC0714728.1 hypothetical protein [Stigmatella ashevillena]